MKARTIAGVLIAGVACLATASTFADAAKPADTAEPAAAGAVVGTAGDDAKLIKSATSAAPAKVGKHATIAAMEGGGKMRTLRQGTNGFTSIPDNPATPGPDPMCMDKTSMDWVHAWMDKKTPPAKVGLMYMLASGTDASNTDPYAEKPPRRITGS
ncbi:MAG TPA: hypothetical protein VN787_01555 [Steroidobacteraceae bacterium]|nr:hypothetical protein [Steroidobacteraceae bacterium]